MYEGLLGETIRLQGHGGDDIEAYFARPLGVESAPGVVVIHHNPGWDEATKEITRKFAHHGYAAVSPHLFSRLGPGDPCDLSAANRAAGGTPDDQAVGDVAGSIHYLRNLPYSNGKIGVIGFCSGGRQTYIVACKGLGIDAAVDCWGGRVIPKPEEVTERQHIRPIDLTPNLECPLLGLFGAEDPNPSPEQVAGIEQELKKHGKTYEFHMYDNAGHGFFAVDRPAYRVHAAVDGWQKVFDFFGKYLTPNGR
jgi:carboxymethylenebutenolidase